MAGTLASLDPVRPNHLPFHSRAHLLIHVLHAKFGAWKKIESKRFRNRKGQAKWRIISSNRRLLCFNRQNSAGRTGACGLGVLGQGPKPRGLAPKHQPETMPKTHQNPPSFIKIMKIHQKPTKIHQNHSFSFSSFSPGCAVWPSPKL